MKNSDQRKTSAPFRLKELEIDVGPTGSSEAVGALPCGTLAIVIFVYGNSNRL
jgi:hypothetical protein